MRDGRHRQESEGGANREGADGLALAGSGHDRDRGIDAVRDRDRWRCLPAGRDRARPSGRNRVHGPELFAHRSGGVVRLRPGAATAHPTVRAAISGRCRCWTSASATIAAPAARLEVLVEYRPRFSFEGHANFLEPSRRQSVAADLSALTGMVAGYVDLPGLGLPKIGPFGPFIGAGVGVVRTRIGQTRMTFPRTRTIVPGASRVGLAWMLTAGVAVALGERATLDLAWRYSDLGEVHTGRGEGRVVWRDGSREPRPLDLAATRANLASHGLLLSVRYAF